VATLSETSLLHAEHLMKAMRVDLTRPPCSSASRTSTQVSRIAPPSPGSAASRRGFPYPSSARQTLMRESHRSK
jgi:hypothetical protein